ncbi:MAG: hypothetical protein K8I02_04650 [Candidatus Methylomirabilis sp.]|nr:hypothetical protein [Deltaproteobacteria bacterium]
MTKYGERFGPWAWWKTQRLLDLAEALARAARRANPSMAAILSLPAESALRPEEALALSSRSLEALASRDFDYLDFASPEAETPAAAFRTELRARLEAAGIDPLRALVEEAREPGEGDGEEPRESVPTLVTLAAAR